MKKLALIATVFGLIANTAIAGVALTGAGSNTTPPSGPTAMITPIIASTETAPSTSSTHYIAVNGGGSTTATDNRETVSPIAGTIGDLHVDVGKTLGAGQYVFTLLVGGSTTSVTCTVTVRSCTSGATASVTAGQTLAFKIDPSGSPTALDAGAWTTAVTFTSTTAGQGLILASVNATNPSTTAKNYAQLGGGSITWNATEANISSLLPTAGTIDGLQVVVTTAPGSGAGWTFTVFKNGSATSLACSISGAVSRTCSDAIGGGHSFTVVASDTISLEACPYNTAGCTAGSAPAASGAKYSVMWSPTTAGEAVYMVTSTNLNNTVTRYSSLLGNSSTTGPTPTESTTAALAPVSLTWKKLYAQIDAGSALSGAQTRSFVNRKGTGSGQSDGTITCTLNSTNTSSCNDTTHTYSASAGDILNWATTPTNTPPANTWYKLGTVFTVP